MKDIGEKLKQIRLEAKFTQSDLALKLGNGKYSKNTVSAIENGKRKVGFEVCQNWADACGYEFSGEFTKK